jgi:hypothetical protein
MSPTAPRTLADQLRSWPDERLATLLEARPDLATPAPADSAQLAGRAVVQEGPTSSEEVRRVVLASPDAVDAALERLADLALVWGGSLTWRPTTMVAELLGVPGGPAAETIESLLAELDDKARAILDHLEETEAAGTVGSSKIPVRPELATSPTEHLLARGLLTPRGERHVVIPWTVQLHLRSGHSTREPVDAVPDLATSERPEDTVARAAAGAAFEFTRRTEMLLEHWATRPPGGLRSGGVGVRELRAAAELLHADAPTAALVVETAAAAGTAGAAR